MGRLARRTGARPARYAFSGFRHPREGGSPEPNASTAALGSRFRGNDEGSENRGPESEVSTAALGSRFRGNDEGSAEASALWITAERLPLFRALWPAGRLEPAIARPAHYADREWPREAALVEILRGRLEGQGPVTNEALAGAARPRGKARSPRPLAALETEGFALRGRFTPGGDQRGMVRAAAARAHPPLHDQAAARRDRAGGGARFPALPARVAARRTRCAHGRARRARSRDRPARRLSGAGRRLGDRDPAGAARRLRAGLARRPVPRRPRRLGAAAAAGRATSNERGASPVRATPIALLPRRHVPLWAALSPTAETAQPSAKARAVADCIREHGASFFDELVEGTGLLGPQVEEALAELVALGVVNSDSFAGLRALLVPAEKRSRRRRRRPDLRHGGRRPLGLGAAAGAAAAAPARSSSTSPARCCAATASCSGGCSSARRRGCRRGASCCASTAGSKRAANSAAAALSRDSPASNSRCPTRSALLRATRRKPTSDALRVAVGRRSAQPRRHPDPRPQARRADGQPGALPRRPAAWRSIRAATSSFSKPSTPPASGRRARRCCAAPHPLPSPTSRKAAGS